MPRMSGKSILIADDEPLLREVLRELFESEGARVEEASGAQEALERTTRFRFDAVLSDLQMPAGDGWAFLDRFREINLDIPFALMMTAKSDVDRSHAYDRGADLVFSKPFQFSEVLESLLRLMTSIPYQESGMLIKNDGLSINSEQVETGRRGLFLGGIYEGKVGQEVVFEAGSPITGTLSGRGILRWIRRDSCRPGVGVEVIALNPTRSDPRPALWLNPFHRAAIPLGLESRTSERRQVDFD